VVRISNPHWCGINEADSLVAHSNRLSSPTSSDPEKRGDMEIVDWDGPNDPGNPYEQTISSLCRGFVDSVVVSIGL
jgi:hypothetical protein